MAGLAAAGGIVMTVTVRATVIAPMDLPDLVAAAPVIAHVRIVGTQAEWTEGRRRIETLVSADVTDALKGRPGETIVFRIPGGEMGPYRSLFVGAPRFEPGDEAVVFLNATAPRIPHLVGLGHGAYRIARGETGTAVVAPGAWQAPGDQPVALARGDRSRRPVELDAFKQQVRALVAQAGAR